MHQFLLRKNCSHPFFKVYCALFTRWTPFCHSLSLTVICCHSLYHSLSFVITRCITHCHSLSFVVTQCTSRLSFYKRSFSTNWKWKWMNRIQHGKKDVVGKQKFELSWKIIHHTNRFISKWLVKKIGFQKLRDLLKSGKQKKASEIYYAESAVRRCS